MITDRGRNYDPHSRKLLLLLQCFCGEADAAARNNIFQPDTTVGIRKRLVNGLIKGGGVLICWDLLLGATQASGLPLHYSSLTPL